MGVDGIGNHIKTIWENGEYGIHNIRIDVYHNRWDADGLNYTVIWRYGNHGYPERGRVKDYNKEIKEILATKSKKR